MPPPPQVVADPVALAYWEHFLRSAPLNLLKPVDSAMLSRLCLELALGDLAADTLREHGHTQITSTKLMIVSPWVSIFHRSTEVARKIASELCLTVSERARMGTRMDVPMPAPDEDDLREDFSAFLESNPQNLNVN